jgi:hypothetical protein
MFGEQLSMLTLGQVLLLAMQLPSAHRRWPCGQELNGGQSAELKAQSPFQQTMLSGAQVGAKARQNVVVLTQLLVAAQRNG